MLHLIWRHMYCAIDGCTAIRGSHECCNCFPEAKHSEFQFKVVVKYNSKQFWPILPFACQTKCCSAVHVHLANRTCARWATQNYYTVLAGLFPTNAFHTSFLLDWIPKLNSTILVEVSGTKFHQNSWKVSLEPTWILNNYSFYYSYGLHLHHPYVLVNLSCACMFAWQKSIAQP